MNRYKLMILLPLVGLAMIGLMAGEGRAQGAPGSEPPGFHGMLLFGSGRIYMSHLPMFTAQHRYQGIWQVSFGAAGDAAYRAELARPGNAGGIFTLAPQELFRLPELMSGRDSFKADVFVGHFERPGHRRLLDGVTVTLLRPVHWHAFLPGDERPAQATYLLFGDDDETFLASWIGAAPSRDQILAVEPASPLGAVPAGAQLVIPGRDAGERLQAGEVASGLLLHAAREGGPIAVQSVQLTVRSEYYLEERELSFTDLAMR